jgi:hypothetical protein
MKRKEPPGPREGSEFGYDPAEAMRGMVRAMFDAPERDGELRPIGVAAGLPKLTPQKRRRLDAAVAIRMEDPDELTFSHSIFCQCAMPTAKPDPGMLEWERRQGRATLLIQAGKAKDPKTGKFVQLGLPYGPKARLLLMHLNSEAVRNQSPVIDVDSSMTAFFRRVMSGAVDGRQIKMLKTQLSALAAATFRLGIDYDDHTVQVNAQVVSAFDLWFTKDEGQRVLWPSMLRLSLDYFESLSKHAVPLDERALAALAKSAMALDIYCWLAQRLHRIPAGRGQFIPWGGEKNSLQEQFGQNYKLLRLFRRDFIALLKQVQDVYKEARIEVDGRGITMWQSPPPVKKRLVMVTGQKFLDLKAEKSEG